MVKRFLYLEDGSVIEGLGFGGSAEKHGEVIFATSTNGYPESFTDPSYKGQMLVMSYPLIGNYGVPREKRVDGILHNFESESPKIEALIVSEHTVPFKWNSIKSLDSWLKESGVPGLCGVDTRSLVKKIRDKGVMKGLMSDHKDDRLSSSLDKWDYEKVNYTEEVSPKTPIVHGKQRECIVLVDFGVKHGILENLSGLGYRIVRVPYSYTLDKIMGFQPKGIVFSNGPGNPALLEDAAKVFRESVESRIPVLGICMGHHIAGMAFGCKISKMKFGHHAVNKAVVNTVTKKAFITTHNHGYAIERKGMPKDIGIFFYSPDDMTVEGLYSKRMNFITAQFHPEARPGTNDAAFIFKMFGKMIKNG